MEMNNMKKYTQQYKNCINTWKELSAKEYHAKRIFILPWKDTNDGFIAQGGNLLKSGTGNYSYVSKLVLEDEGE
jgi:hypothetical protein